MNIDRKFGMSDRKIAMGRYGELFKTYNNPPTNPHVKSPVIEAIRLNNILELADYSPTQCIALTKTPEGNDRLKGASETKQSLNKVLLGPHTDYRGRLVNNPVRIEEVINNLAAEDAMIAFFEEFENVPFAQGKRDFLGNVLSRTGIIHIPHARVGMPNTLGEESQRPFDKQVWENIVWPQITAGLDLDRFDLNRDEMPGFSLTRGLKIIEG